MVYTDMIAGSATNGDGDLPIVIGSFSANLDQIKGVWKMEANPSDVFPTQEEKLPMEAFPKILQTTTDTLRAKTRFELVPRPETFRQGLKEEDALKLAKAAVKDKEINSTLDTGYDIVWPPFWKVGPPKK
jgi:hypothetical protein